MPRGDSAFTETTFMTDGSSDAWRSFLMVYERSCTARSRLTHSINITRIFFPPVSCCDSGLTFLINGSFPVLKWQWWRKSLTRTASSCLGSDAHYSSSLFILCLICDDFPSLFSWWTQLLPPPLFWPIESCTSSEGQLHFGGLSVKPLWDA